MMRVPNRMRYKKFWYRSVLDMIKNYKILSNTNSEELMKFKVAIDATFEKLQNDTDGKDIIRAVHMVYIDDTHGMTGAADQLHVSVSTIKRWLSRFVYAVGEEIGYK